MKYIAIIERRSPPRGPNPHRFDTMPALVGSGRDLWADEHADELERRPREGWE